MILQKREEFFEITLTGGEITLHPQFLQILEATHILDRTTSTFVTNATRITPELARDIGISNVGRVCVSLDGPDAQTHNSRRGNNFEKSDTWSQGLKRDGCF